MFRRSGPRSAVDEDFAQFVAERSAPLLRTAWLLTGDAARAEELLLTALSAAWAKWAWILGGGPPEEYVRRVLVTRYLSRRRFEAPTSVLPAAGQAHDEVVRSANRDTVRRALAGLTRQQRAVVVLRYVEAYPSPRPRTSSGALPQPSGSRRVGHSRRCGSTRASLRS